MDINVCEKQIVFRKTRKDVKDIFEVRWGRKSNGRHGCAFWHSIYGRSGILELSNYEALCALQHELHS